jgi:toxin ParE1/3/4
MRIRWTQAAADDFESIANYLTEHHPTYIHSTILEIHQRIQSLLSFSSRGRPGRIEGTRELVIPRLPYIVVYRIAVDDVEILHIYHGSQQR